MAQLRVLGQHMIERQDGPTGEPKDEIDPLAQEGFTDDVRTAEARTFGAAVLRVLNHVVQLGDGHRWVPPWKRPKPNQASRRFPTLAFWAINNRSIAAGGW